MSSLPRRSGICSSRSTSVSNSVTRAGSHPDGRARAGGSVAAGHRDRAIDLLRVAVLQARQAGLLAQRIQDAERALREAEAAPDTA